jgi:hypothetical protein
MARRTNTALLEQQPALWGDDPPSQPAPATPAPPTAAKKRSNRHHVLSLPRPWTSPMPCISSCLTCGRPDGLGVCAGGCAVVCGRPDKTGPVEVCLLTLTLPARRISRHAVVECPHCDGTHWHTPAPGRRYRVGQCGQPYIVHLAERSAT